MEKIEVDFTLSEFNALRMTRFELVCSRSTLDWLVLVRGLSLRYLRVSVFVLEKLLLELVGPEADYELIFEPIIELVPESAID